MAKKKQINELLGVGRRKTAVAAVRLRNGKGKIKINGREFENYFTSSYQQEEILAPLAKCDSSGKYDIIIRLKGGGIEAQVIAARLGISRALVLGNEDFKTTLKEVGYLTRDPRKKERKKYGLAGARKSFQFSKR
ncbi:MAG: 30S ribosomal protein S9 [Candidatus Anoxychlamydiales bacterium]|nr:30S ribosomal protein S9 [Candidatus Anoxychlamydiales bacterium]